MPTLTVRPDATIQAGSWTVSGGSSAHAVLADEVDGSYVSNVNRATLDSQVLKLGLADVSLPAGAKIFSVGVRIRTWSIVGTQVQPQCLLRFVQRVVTSLYWGSLTGLFKTVFGFDVPRTSTNSWQTVTLAQYLEHPAGGEWTQASFNDFELHIGRNTATGGTTLWIGAVWVDVTYNERPVVTASGPVGTVSDTTRPRVTWTYSDPDSDPQQAYRVRVFTPAQWGVSSFDPDSSPATADSGWRSGEDLAWAVDVDLTNGAWRAYVAARQVWEGIGDHQSAWAYTEWTQNVPGPPTPSVVATYEPALNRVRLDLAKGGSSPATETYNVQCSDDAGASWGLVRGGVQLVADADGAAGLYDHEAPENVARWYRCQAFRTLGTVKVASSFSPTATVVAVSTDTWLKDPLNPPANMILPVAADTATQPRPQGVFAPLTAEGTTARKIVVSGPPYGHEGTLSLVFLELPAQWEAFMALYSPGRTLLLQYPTGVQRYVALGPSLDIEWEHRDTAERYRKVSVGYVEVAS